MTNPRGPTITLPCETCGLVFNKLVSEVRRSKRHFCSEPCYRNRPRRNNLRERQRRARAKLPKEYKCWQNMNQRCNNPRDAAFKDYGGRGIKVCDRWNSKIGGTFKNFSADMGPRPSMTHTLDRINNDGNYEPSNCRWATKKQQNRNTRVLAAKKITFRGESLLPCEWAERFGLTPKIIHDRLKRRGWPIERAITQPIRRWPTSSAGDGSTESSQTKVVRVPPVAAPPEPRSPRPPADSHTETVQDFAMAGD